MLQYIFVFECNLSYSYDFKCYKKLCHVPWWYHLIDTHYNKYYYLYLVGYPAEIWKAYVHYSTLYSMFIWSWRSGVLLALLRKLTYNSCKNTCLIILFRENSLGVCVYGILDKRNAMMFVIQSGFTRHTSQIFWASELPLWSRGLPETLFKELLGNSFFINSG